MKILLLSVVVIVIVATVAAAILVPAPETALPATATTATATATTATATTTQAPRVRVFEEDKLNKLTQPEVDAKEKMLILAETLLRFFRQGVFDSYAVFASYVGDLGFANLFSEKTYDRLSELSKQNALTEMDILRELLV